VVGALKEFLLRSLLWWFEAMSLLESVPTAVSWVHEAHRWAVCHSLGRVFDLMMRDIGDVFVVLGWH
jgi:hypothetical protein